VPTRKRASAQRIPAADLPIARVAIDTPLPHLDRPFDYLVDGSQDAAAQPGCRVRVRFAGKLTDGYLLERVENTDHVGRLSFLERVVSPEPVLTAEIAGLARAVADRWAGTLSDVLRLAIPPRHAAAEAMDAATPVPASPLVDAAAVDDAADPTELIDGLAGAEPVRAVVTLGPGSWPDALASMATAVVRGGRSALVVVPDHRDVARVDRALTRALGPGRHVALEAGLGPSERYRRFLTIRRGEVRCAVGTRAAVWAPLPDLGAIVVWDDGDDLHAEPRAPYCHTRDVAILRAHRAGAGLVLAGHGATAEAAALVGRGWAGHVDGSVGARDRLPAIRPTADAVDADDPVVRAARLPTLAWRAARSALDAGAPVLVQVPRRGYQPAVACNRCRQPARCERCAGPLGRTAADRPPVCRWCGSVVAAWVCPDCGGRELRAVVVGARRTADELGRAFPGVPVRTSGGDHVLDDVPDEPALVVATPGAEPVAARGFGAALLLDGAALLARPDLRAGEEALRRWLNAAALVRPAAAGGVVIVGAPAELRPVQSLLRWAPWWHAEREYADRAALHLPPAARLAALTGAAAAVEQFLADCELPAGAEVLGPVPVPMPARGSDGEAARLLVRVPPPAGGQLAAALKAAAAGRSARKEQGVVRVELDPIVVG
jgi:primosomal protein N' (replication factor Y)